jgi:hypothetical protein
LAGFCFSSRRIRSLQRRSDKIALIFTSSERTDSALAGGARRDAEETKKGSQGSDSVYLGHDSSHSKRFGSIRRRDVPRRVDRLLVWRRMDRLRGVDLSRGELGTGEPHMLRAQCIWLRGIGLQIEYKLQDVSAATPSPSEDRVFLFEEIVPPAYQDQIANPKQKKSGGLFSRTKPTRQVTPHRESQAPPTRDEAVFDAILRRHTPTKQVSLSKPFNGSTGRAELGIIAATPVSTEGSPFKSGPRHHNSSSEGTPSMPRTPHGTMRALFRRRNSQEPGASLQPAPLVAADYDQIETRTLSGPSSGESGWGEDDQVPNAPRPERREGDRWIGKTSSFIRVLI